MKKYEMYKGESKVFSLDIENEPVDADLTIAIVKSNNEIVFSFSTKDGSLFEQEGSYICELTSEMSMSIPASTYLIECKIESASAVTIQQIAELHIKHDTIYKTN